MSTATKGRDEISEGLVWSAMLEVAHEYVRCHQEHVSLEHDTQPDASTHVLLTCICGALKEASDHLTAAAAGVGQGSPEGNASSALEQLDVVVNLLDQDQPDRLARNHPAGVRRLGSGLHGVRFIADRVIDEVRSELDDSRTPAAEQQ